ncbi:hypothetical protein [Lentisalinibacter sediminis]|uniref:hypothetical protein n=1 Tax=Lentisalinibacter sediminis TaxID=2992237 RepID=UPI00386ED168
MLYPDPHIVSSLTAGAAFAAAFLLTSKCWQVAGGLLRRPSPLGVGIRTEPGDDLRRQLRDTDIRAAMHLAAAFVLLSVFVALLFAGSDRWWSDLQPWAWWLVSLFLAAVAAYEVRVLLGLLQTRLRAARSLNAHIATAQRLEYVAARGNYLFHCVPVGDTRIDHIVLGTNGLYAVHVIDRPPRGDRTASLEAGSVVFGAEGGEPHTLKDWRSLVARLTRELEAGLGRALTIRSVIVVPGWDVSSAEERDTLLVNQSALTMMTGWRDQRAFLLDEEVADLERLLTKRVSA